MNKKTQDYRAGARTWIEKNAESDLDTKPVSQALDTKPVSQALDAAEKAIRDVEELREKLAVANGEQRATFLVLQETLKSAKHARKARYARDKADKKTSRAKVKPKTTRATK